MKSSFLDFAFLIFLFLLTLPASSQDQNPDWENPAVFGKNKMDAHSYFIPYRSRKTALVGDPSKSDGMKLLNGDWQFQLLNNPDDAPANFFTDDYDSSNWDLLPVPSN